MIEKKTVLFCDGCNRLFEPGYPGNIYPRAYALRGLAKRKGWTRESELDGFGGTRRTDLCKDCSQKETT